jgi:hypothetical protein
MVEVTGTGGGTDNKTGAATESGDQKKSLPRFQRAVGQDAFSDPLVA